MNRTIAKTGAFAGAIAGTSTVLLLLTIYVAQSARVILEAFVLIVGNVILYVLPIGALGGAFAGLALGAVCAELGRLMKGTETGAHTSALYGGIAGGILIGLTPIWIGFAYV